MRFLFLFQLLLTVSCGFEPIYKNTVKPINSVNDIKIESNNSKEAFYIKEVLYRHFENSNTPLYILKLTPSVSKNSEVITSTNEITSYNLLLKVDYELKKIGTEEKYTGLTTSAKTSYSATTTYTGYATQVAENDAKKRLARKVAKDIILRLSIISQEDSK